MTNSVPVPPAPPVPTKGFPWWGWIIVIFIIMPAIGTGLFYLFTYLFVKNISEIKFPPTGPGPAPAPSPAPAPAPSPKSDTIIITDEGTKLENYIEMPLAQTCLLGSNDDMSMCASMADETEMNYVYDPIGGSLNSDGAFKTTYDSDEQKCSDGTTDCVYTENFSKDDERKLIGITNAKGEDFIQKFVDDVWSGKIDLNKKVPHPDTGEMAAIKDQFKDILEFDKTTGEMFMNRGGKRVKLIPGYVQLHGGPDITEFNIPVGMMILYIIFYYYGNDLPKPTIKLDLKSEKTLGQVYKEMKEASQSPQP